MSKYRIQTLNNIAASGLERFPLDRYEVAEGLDNPDAMMLRSASLHDMSISASLKAVGRAGAGVNNIPVQRLTEAGIPVFNAPGANANAVKELVVAGMLLGCRNICQAWDYTRALTEAGDALNKAVEQGKKAFVGTELPGRTLGVVGLGAIGVQVANVAQALGMKVLGYDPSITVRSAWQLSAAVEQTHSVDDLLARSDFVTFHVPLTDETRHLISVGRLPTLKKGVVVMNFAREGIVDDAALLKGIDQGLVQAYITDFPSAELRNRDRVIALPHLGASTRQAEENCAVMVADQLRDYLERGAIRNSVNFPELDMPAAPGCRIAVVNRNVPNMVGQISTLLGERRLNIIDFMNRSRGDIAYNLIDVECEGVSDETQAMIGAIDGVLSVRVV